MSLVFHVLMNIVLNIGTSIHYLIINYLSKNDICSAIYVILFIMVLNTIKSYHKCQYLEIVQADYHKKIHVDIESWVNNIISGLTWNSSRKLLQTTDIDRIKNYTIYATIGFSDVIFTNIHNICMFTGYLIYNIYINHNNIIILILTIVVILVLIKLPTKDSPSSNKIWDKYRYYSTTRYHELIHGNENNIHTNLFNCIEHYQKNDLIKRLNNIKRTEIINTLVDLLVTGNLILQLLNCTDVSNMILHIQFMTITKSGITCITNSYKAYIEISQNRNDLLNIFRKNAKRNICNQINFQSITIQYLEYSYPNSNNFDVKLIDPISFKIGDIIRLEGASGNGKSTFMDIIAGIIPSDEYQHSILFDDIYNIDGFDAIIDSRVYAEQCNMCNWNASIKEIICGSYEYDIDCITNTLLIANCSDFIDLSDTNNLEKYISKNLCINLSGGQQVRIAIAKIIYQVIVTKPKILILDEIDKSLQSDLAVSIIKSISNYCVNNDICCIIAVHNTEAKNLSYHQVLNFNQGEITYE
ncbi:putative ABC transporter ATP-binding protein/permease [Powai lake megavirus]|uniref:Putative ABC transporter ATP-binding protein/permease n=1 Tax=Powai lake megavirus TaxID=1842663 RepID=A0A167R584_9VIRU|nr:putative ABC transporter ATP-binding protein/permease [Powai lake megavirus]ANB50323.1 putative ABC transporter ATP-binding protein/permease [Powai lake megavirus]